MIIPSLGSQSPNLQGLPPVPLPIPGGGKAIPAPELRELPVIPGIPGESFLQRLPATQAPFESLLRPLVEGVQEKQNSAGSTLSALLSGQNVALHQAVIAMEEASVSFQLLVEVRNKLLEAYQELMRMQI